MVRMWFGSPLPDAGATDRAISCRRQVLSFGAYRSAPPAAQVARAPRPPAPACYELDGPSAALLREARARSAAMPDFEPAVEAVLVAIPAGEVMTYGEVAAEAGFPGAARAVG